MVLTRMHVIYIGIDFNLSKLKFPTTISQTDNGNDRRFYE